MMHVEDLVEGDYFREGRDTLQAKDTRTVFHLDHIEKCTDQANYHLILSDGRKWCVNKLHMVCLAAKKEFKEGKEK